MQRGLRFNGSTLIRSRRLSGNHLLLLGNIPRLVRISSCIIAMATYYGSVSHSSGILKFGIGHLEFLSTPARIMFCIWLHCTVPFCTFQIDPAPLAAYLCKRTGSHTFAIRLKRFPMRRQKLPSTRIAVHIPCLVVTTGLPINEKETWPSDAVMLFSVQN